MARPIKHKLTTLTQTGYIVSVKGNLCCYCEEGPRATGLTQLVILRLGPPDSPALGDGNVTPLGLAHSTFCLLSRLCFFLLAQDNSNSGPWHQGHGKQSQMQGP